MILFIYEIFILFSCAYSFDQVALPVVWGNVYEASFRSRWWNKIFLGITSRKSFFPDGVYDILAKLLINYIIIMHDESFPVKLMTMAYKFTNMLKKNSIGYGLASNPTPQFSCVANHSLALLQSSNCLFPSHINWSNDTQESCDGGEERARDYNSACSGSNLWLLCLPDLNPKPTHAE